MTPPKELTDRQRNILSRMKASGGNPLSYTAASIAAETGMKRATVTNALDSLYAVHRLVERIDTNKGIIWRRVFTEGEESPMEELAPKKPVEPPCQVCGGKRSLDVLTASGTNTVPCPKCRSTEFDGVYNKYPAAE